MIDWVTGRRFEARVFYISTKLNAMAASLYIVVEGEDPGFDIFVNGRALARNEDALERLAETLRVTPLLHFFSADENSMCFCSSRGAAIRSGHTTYLSRNGLIRAQGWRPFAP